MRKSLFKFSNLLFPSSHLSIFRYNIFSKSFAVQRNENRIGEATNNKRGERINSNNLTQIIFKENYLSIDEQITSNKLFLTKEELLPNYFGEILVFLANSQYILNQSKKIELSGCISLFLICIILNSGSFLFLKSTKILWMVKPYFYITTCVAFYRYYKNLMKMSNKIYKEVMSISINKASKIASISYETGLISPTNIDNIKMAKKSLKYLLKMAKDSNSNVSRMIFYTEILGALKIKARISVRSRKPFHFRVHYSELNFQIFCVILNPKINKINMF